MRSPEPGAYGMPSPSAKARAIDLEWIRVALHDLSQPLTALECLLYINTLPPHGVGRAQAGPEVLQQTMAEALLECTRMMRMVRTMQERILPECEPSTDQSLPVEKT